MKDTKETLPIFSLNDSPQELIYDFHPKQFDDYIGQSELKEKLKLYAHAAQQRNEPLDHLLLFGPPGLGKTTLANIIAHEMKVHIKICSGPMLDRTGDLVAILTSLDRHDVLFIDEIHRMPINVEEVLYNAMEHFRVDVIIGQGAAAQAINIPIHPFTLIGATTKTGLLSAPLRSRFGIIERLNFYTEYELQQIIEHHAQFLGIAISTTSARMIARCARGTPRIAKKTMRRVRDIAQVTNNNVVDEPLVTKALSMLGLDADGLSSLDNMILKTIIEKFDGGPVGIETIASLLGEESTTVEEVYEPFLLRQGFLEKTARGRQIPQKALRYLQRKYLGQQHFS